MTEAIAILAKVHKAAQAKTGHLMKETTRMLTKHLSIVFLDKLLDIEHCLVPCTITKNKIQRMSTQRCHGARGLTRDAICVLLLLTVRKTCLRERSWLGEVLHLFKIAPVRIMPLSMIC